MRRSVASLCTAALAAWLGLAHPAHAQGNDKAAAVLLYDEAARLTSAGKLGEACTKYAESHRLDPQLGTLLHLGDCYEKNGQSASAWAAFREATELANNRNDGRAKVARKRAAALEARVPKLLIDVVKPSATPGLRVERDGNWVGAGGWGVAVPTDPGAHIVSASAAGRTSWSETVTVPASGVVKITVPELAPASASAVGAGAPGATSPPLNAANIQVAPAAPSVDEAQPSSGSGQRVAGFVLIGVGAVGAGVGAVFAARAVNRNNAAKDICKGQERNCPDNDVQTRDDLNDEVKSARLGAIVGFAAGGAALAGGLVLVLTAGGSRQTVGLAPVFYGGGGGGGVLSGSF